MKNFNDYLVEMEEIRREDSEVHNEIFGLPTSGDPNADLTLYALIPLVIGIVTRVTTEVMWYEFIKGLQFSKKAFPSNPGLGWRFLAYLQFKARAKDPDYELFEPRGWDEDGPNVKGFQKYYLKIYGSKDAEYREKVEKKKENERVHPESVNYDVFSEWRITDFFKSSKFDSIKSSFKSFSFSNLEALLKFKYKDYSISNWVDKAVSKILAMRNSK